MLSFEILHVFYGCSIRTQKLSYKSDLGWQFPNFDQLNIDSLAKRGININVRSIKVQFYTNIIIICISLNISTEFIWIKLSGPSVGNNFTKLSFLYSRLRVLISNSRDTRSITTKDKCSKNNLNRSSVK